MGSQVAILEALLLTGIALSGFGLLINAAAALAVAASKLSRWPVRAVVCSLLASDLLLSGASLSLTALQYAQNFGPAADLAARRRAACTETLLQCLWDTATTANLLTLLAMAAEHFVGVRWPLHYGSCLRRSRVIGAIALVWAVSLALGFAKAALIAASDGGVSDQWRAKGTTHFCYKVVIYSTALQNGTSKYELGQRSHDRALMGVAAALVLSVMAVIAAIYTYIFRVVFRLSRVDRKLGPTNGRKRAIVTTFILTATFCACYLPYFFACVATLAGEDAVDLHGSDKQIFGLALNLTVLVTCLADPFIYIRRIKEVRRGFKKSVQHILGTTTN